MIIIYIVIGLILILIIGKIFNAQKYKIRTQSGIQKTDFITIGGIGQYIQIRGQDSLNPIIIVLHGGPGNNMAYYSYDWQSALEKEYTIVHWDQRGCGNTYYKNTKVEKPTLELLLSDLDELVDYLCSEYAKENVIIMGHSWGTFLGGTYAAKYPKKTLAYIGVGQFNDVWQSEKCATEEAVRLANMVGKTDDANKIEAQFQLVLLSPQLDMREFMKLRQFTGKYLPTGNNTSVFTSLFSPYMTFNDLRWFFTLLFSFDKFIGIQEKLYEPLYSKHAVHSHTKYEGPVVIIAGDCDWITPYSRAQNYFDDVATLEKRFILIEQAGHIPFGCGKFTEKLLNALNEIL